MTLSKFGRNILVSSSWEANEAEKARYLQAIVRVSQTSWDSIRK